MGIFRRDRSDAELSRASKRVSAKTSKEAALQKVLDNMSPMGNDRPEPEGHIGRHEPTGTRNVGECADGGTISEPKEK